MKKIINKISPWFNKTTIHSVPPTLQYDIHKTNLWQEIFDVEVEKLLDSYEAKKLDKTKLITILHAMQFLMRVKPVFSLARCKKLLGDFSGELFLKNNPGVESFIRKLQEEILSMETTRTLKKEKREYRFP